MLNSPEPRRSPAIRLIRFLRLVYALPLGLAIAGVVGGFVLDYGWYIAAASIGLGLSILVLTLGSADRSLRGTASPQGMRFVQQHGDRALAKIERLKTTGTQINDAYVTELKLVVAPPNETAYRATARALIHPLRSAAYQPGTVVVVKHSPRHPGVVVVDADPPREWTDRPWQVGVIGEERTPEPEARQGNAAGRLAMTAVSTFVVAAALLVPIRHDVLGQLLFPPELFAADDLRTAVAKLSAESERFEDLTVESDQLRATIPGAYLSYRGGTVKRDSTSTGVPKKQFAASEVNFAAIPGLVASFGGEPADARVIIRREDAGITMTVRSGKDSDRELVADAKGVPALTTDAFTEQGFQEVSRAADQVERPFGSVRSDHPHRSRRVPGARPWRGHFGGLRLASRTSRRTPARAHPAGSGCAAVRVVGAVTENAARHSREGERAHARLPARQGFGGVAGERRYLEPKHVCPGRLWPWLRGDRFAGRVDGRGDAHQVTPTR
ncbi:hypothetical protein [Amycolatopsis circi]|uniref:hypothetical protein n=1 Tax=Amycolatopsis circi TaxID=871959 RepID=UPI000E247736|nr:hypothetical protein [Amycolatopsis circi]